jgi:maleylacetoacetate isomerase
MRLYGYWRSSAAWRVRIALALKGLEAEAVPVHLARGGGEQKLPAYLATNPQGLVPALEAEGQVLTQSLAIIEWLDEVYPAPSLLPGDAFHRARIRAFALAIACEIHPLQNLRVQQFLRHEMGQGKEAIQGWLQRWLGQGMAACEALLTHEPEGQAFAFGPEPTLADIMLAPQIYSADRFGVSLAECPRITALGERYAVHPAFADTHPARQPDAEA